MTTSKYIPVHMTPLNTPPVRIYLDGAEVRGVVEAHRVEGWLIRYVNTEDGEPIVGADGNLLTEKLYGRVTAEHFDGSPS